MRIHTFTVGPFQENTYLLQEGDNAMLIDPGFSQPSETTLFFQHLDDLKTDLIAVCLTHAHIDHILGLASVLKKQNVPVYLNHSDLLLWKEFPEQAKRFGLLSAPSFDFIPEPLPESKRFELGPFQFQVLYTPGHSPDHVSLYFKEEELLIGGDAIFRQSIGRTDLYKGDFELLSKSIKTKIYTLPEKTKILPGHGPETTVGYEKENNAFVKA